MLRHTEPSKKGLLLPLCLTVPNLEEIF